VGSAIWSILREAASRGPSALSDILVMHYWALELLLYVCMYVTLIAIFLSCPFFFYLFRGCYFV